MQRYTVFFIIVNALHVSGGFSAHHQELKNCTHSIWYVPGLLVVTASVGKLQLTHDNGKKQKNLDKYPMLCVQFWAPDDGRRNRLKHAEQRFSNFFQVGTTFISQNVLRTTLLLGLSNSLGLP